MDMEKANPKLVVTLPRGVDPLAFARNAKSAGADLLEVRDDLTPHIHEIDSVASALPILLARRTEQPLLQELIECAEIVDQDISLERQQIEGTREMLSLHADMTLETEFAVNLWRSAATGDEAIKHVEPYELGCELRLTRLQQVLNRIYSEVTVLAMGEGSAEARRLLSRWNSLHYCSLDEDTASAPGQPLLADEVVRLKRVKGNE